MSSCLRRPLYRRSGKEFKPYKEGTLKTKKVYELKQILDELHTKRTGRKADLIQRIIDWQKDKNNFLSDDDDDYKQPEIIETDDNKNESLLIFGFIQRCNLNCIFPIVLVRIIKKYVNKYETLVIEVNRRLRLDPNIKQHIYSNIIIKNHAHLRIPQDETLKKLNIFVYNDIILKYKANINVDGMGYKGGKRNTKSQREEAYINNKDDDGYYSCFGSGGDGGTGHTRYVRTGWGTGHYSTFGGRGGNGGGVICLTVFGDIIMGKGSGISANGEYGHNANSGDGGSIDINCYGNLDMTRTNCYIKASAGGKNAKKGRIRIKSKSKLKMRNITPTPQRIIIEQDIEKNDDLIQNTQEKKNKRNVKKRIKKTRKRKQLKRVVMSDEDEDDDVMMSANTNCNNKTTWNCKRCTLTNDYNVLRCVVCDKIRPRK